MTTSRGRSRRQFLTTLGATAALTGVSAPPVPAASAPQSAPAPSTLDDTARLLKALSEAPGPAGFEEEPRKIVVSELSALGAKIEYDGLGSVLATLPGGAASGPRVMVTAHLDEVGLMVQHITADGFLRVKALGGVLDQALPDQRWTILGRNGPVPAITGLRTTHVLPASQRGVVWPIDETFLDVGASSREEVESLGVRPGDGIAPLSSFLALPNGRYAGKAWDDRVGLGVMIAAARRIRAEGIKLPAPIVWVATTQEEIGLRGAQTAVQKARPDLGISIEAGVSADYPAIGPTQAQERLGAGPGLFLLDSSMIPNRKLRDFFFDVAQQAKIPLQPNVLTGYGEDGAEIQRFDSGRPTVNMTVPTRYLHAHTGIIQRADFDRAVELLIQVLTRLDAAKVGALASFAP